ncbi:MAG: peptidoglycan-binding protein [Parcubacteria group bacterium]|nr:peptidoglycan-binding protein [Parcubacteria group bacterium]
MVYTEATSAPSENCENAVRRAVAYATSTRDTVPQCQLVGDRAAALATYFGFGADCSTPILKATKEVADSTPNNLPYCAHIVYSRVRKAIASVDDIMAAVTQANKDAASEAASSTKNALSEAAKAAKAANDTATFRLIEAQRCVLPDSALDDLEKKYGLTPGPHCGSSASVSLDPLSVETFTRNLKIGNSGADVLALQKILNRNIDTQIASTGPGSPGNETSYFGPLTKAAVIKFQEKYVVEILAPFELTSGTGFVGAATRKVLNSL